MMQPIATFPSDRAQEVRVSLVSYGGCDTLDLRVYAVHKTTGEIGPTKAGIRVSLDHLRDLREAITTAERVAREQGWLDGR